ncbi:MAG: thiamine pyrophosphokinase [Eubacteriales bacterium]|nr:thiamine pyrophosphokinase [Eubacteriales bacterium]
MFDCAVALAGKCADIDGVTRLCPLADIIIAADGGADNLLSAGIDPDWVIGDNDSAQMSLPEKSIQILFPQDKDYTDGELALSLALFLTESDVKIKSKEALWTVLAAADSTDHVGKLIAENLALLLVNNFRQAKDLNDFSILVLFPFGKRQDHSWTNVLLAASLARSGAHVYLSDGFTIVRIIADKVPLQAAFDPQVLDSITLTSQSELAFSAVPLDDNVRGFTVKGMKWDLDQADLAYNKSTAVSNRPRDGEKPDPYISLETGTVMLILTPAD